ncbi:MAG TPA: TIGR03617 family F420-dependent LLM class oxidoreductase [Acetobacteraceae bacterium]|nr:TIGR03617 family F420-dependent LLM class oxidoreductase [Acetobacteraceae bacterium]
MRVLNTLHQADLRKTAESARASEQAGYDAVMTMENKHDPFLAHAIAAVSTSRIELGTSVAIAFPRSPMVVANACWDLQNASGGRFVLGIGPQIRPHNERRFSVRWTAPAPRLREYVQALRAIWTTWEKGEKLDFQGEHYTFTLMPPYFVPPSSGQKMVPVTLAAVGPHSLRLAGEIGDGVRLHGFCTRRYLAEEIVPKIEQGMLRTGRSRQHFEITGGGFIATGPDEAAVAKMFEVVRGRVAFYGSTPGYWGVLELHGLGDLGRELNAMSKQGKWTEMAARVSDDVVHLFAAVGTYKDITARIEERFGGLSDALNMRADSSTHQDLPPDLLQDIKRIPTPFRGYRTVW